jgi:hypothetical protein
MRVLIAAEHAAHGEPWDVYCCEEGELLTLGPLSDRDFAEDLPRCGGSRSFTGVDSGKATTVGVAAVLSDDEVAERLRRAPNIARSEEQGGKEWREMFEWGVVEISEFLEVFNAQPGEAYRVERRRDGETKISLT